MKRLFAVFFLLLGTVLSAVAVELPDALSKSHVSFVVSDVATGKTLVAHNADQMAVPASITKLLTTATVLELLGGDYKIPTKIGTNGTIRSGVLEGDLIVVGGGDPSFGSRYFGQEKVLQNLCDAIKRLKIKRITGNVVVDASCYETAALPAKWPLEDVGNYFAAGVFGLSFADNTTKITLNTGEVGSTPEIVDFSPKFANFELVNRLQTANIDSAYSFGLPYDNRRILSGKVPARRTNYVLKADLPNPPIVFAENFRNSLISNGIQVDGTYEENHAKSISKLFFSHHSPSLAELCRVTNYFSNNNYAEHLLKQISLNRNSFGTLASSLSIQQFFWQTLGVDFAAVNIFDGSGLSPQTQFSANFLNHILLKMVQSPNYLAFYSSIPKAGTDGTVRNFMKTSDWDIRAKSGSLGGVQSYAGYATKFGETLSFCIIVNGFENRKTVRQAIEKLLQKEFDKAIFVAEY